MGYGLRMGRAKNSKWLQGHRESLVTSGKACWIPIRYSSGVEEALEKAGLNERAE